MNTITKHTSSIRSIFSLILSFVLFFCTVSSVSAAPITLGQEASSGPKWGVNTISATFGSVPANNDIIILTYKNSQGSASTPHTWPAGFTEFVTGNDSNNGLFIAWKRASNESSATYTLTLNAATDSNQLLQGQTWKNATTIGSPLDVVGPRNALGFVTVGAQTWPSITTTLNDSLHVLVLAGSAGLNQPTVTGYTPLFFDSAHWLPMYYRTVPLAGSTGSPSGAFTGGNMFLTRISYALHR